MEENWSTLPEHLLFDLIAKRLSFPDLIRFGCVCKTWKSVCAPLQFPNHLPWLLVPLNNNTNNKSIATKMAFDKESPLGFYSLCDGNTYRADIPEIIDRRICGSFPGGWLMTVHENSEIQLFNPLSGSLLNLPPVTTFPSMLHTFEQKEEGNNNNVSLFYVGKRFDSPNTFTYQSKYTRDMYIRKVALSSSSLSLSSGTVVMSVQGLDCKLAYYKIGGSRETWTLATQDQIIMSFFRDVTCYKGVFYAVHNNGYVVAIKDLEGEEGTHPYAEEIIGRHPYCAEFKSYYYILESSGDLLVVLRKLVLEKDHSSSSKEDKRGPHNTGGFKVLKLDFGTPNKWVEIQSLGDRSLFVGNNSSFSICSSDFSGCKPNCIYFTDHFGYYFHEQGYGGYDYGIFNLEDGSIEKILYPNDNLMVMPPPIWFAPSPMIS